MFRNTPAKNVPFEIVPTPGEGPEVVIDPEFTPFQEVEEEPVVIDVTPKPPSLAMIAAEEAAVLVVEASKLVAIGVAAVVVFVVKHSAGIVWAVLVAVFSYVRSQVPSREPWEDADWGPLRPSPPSRPKVNVETNVNVGPGGDVNVTTNVTTR